MGGEENKKNVEQKQQDPGRAMERVLHPAAATRLQEGGRRQEIRKSRQNVRTRAPGERVG